MNKWGSIISLFDLRSGESGHGSPPRIGNERRGRVIRRERGMGAGMVDLGREWEESPGSTRLSESKSSSH